MKSLKTYNMDQDVIAILKRQPNKSQFVCRAVRRYQRIADEFRGVDCETTDLIRWLVQKEDISSQLSALLKHEFLLKANS